MPRLGVLDESDDALMERTQHDDAVAFKKLYQRHWRPAFQIANSVCHNDGHADEAVQEGFLSIWRGRAEYQPQEGASFRAWAFQIVRNRAIDAQRSRTLSRRPPIAAVAVEEISEGASPSVLDEILDSDRNHELRGLLMRLPEAQAEVINLAFFRGLTHAQIADRLAIPPGTVKGRMRLGMEKLRRGGDRLK